jgi:hypothetical protein
MFVYLAIKSACSGTYDVDQQILIKFSTHQLLLKSKLDNKNS